MHYILSAKSAAPAKNALSATVLDKLAKILSSIARECLNLNLASVFDRCRFPIIKAQAFQFDFS